MGKEKYKMAGAQGISKPSASDSSWKLRKEILQQ